MGKRFIDHLCINWLVLRLREFANAILVVVYPEELVDSCFDASTHAVVDELPRSLNNGVDLLWIRRYLASFPSILGVSISTYAREGFGSLTSDRSREVFDPHSFAIIKLPLHRFCVCFDFGVEALGLVDVELPYPRELRRVNGIHGVASHNLLEHLLDLVGCILHLFHVGFTSFDSFIVLFRWGLPFVFCLVLDPALGYLLLLLLAEFSSLRLLPRENQVTLDCGFDEVLISFLFGRVVAAGVAGLHSSSDVDQLIA